MTAQNDLKIGQWKTYLPYERGLYVTQSNTHVYYSTGISILKLDKSDLSVERIDRVTGLSEATPSLIRFNKSNNTLMVVYSNSSIDLVKPDGTVVLLNDIKSNNSIIGDKRVYDVFFSQDTAFMACGFGLVRLNMKRNEFISTTFTRRRVNSVTLFNGRVYAATEGGVFSVANDNRVNIADFAVWQRLNGNGFPNGEYNSNALCVFNNSLYLDVNDTLKMWQGGTPLSIYNRSTFKIQYLTAEGNNLMAGFLCGFDCGGEIQLFDKNNNRTRVSDCNFRPQYGVEDAQGKLYFGELFPPIRFKKNATAPCDNVIINAPNFASGSDIAITDSSIVIASGGVVNNGARISGDGFSEFKNGKWTNFNRFNFPVLSDSMAEIAMEAVAVNPFNGKIYCGTYWGGLIEVTNGKITRVFNKNNSTLQGATGDEARTRVAGLVFDKAGNLWVANTLAPFPVSILKADGRWQRMGSVPSGSSLIFKPVIDSSGYKWFTSGNAIASLLVYDEGKNLTDLSDDRVRAINNNSFPKELQSAKVNCISVDLEGRVWVGTTSGVAVFDCGNDPFRDNCVARLIISSLGGINEYLLRERNVQAIAVDGANRKWFGTTSGIFVTSADGREEVAKFNTDNSPLMSNNITAINIRQKTGEVFIATNRGLMVYKTDAIAGFQFNQDTAYAYPNPVRPEYQGPIAIKGLAQDANVKITDANGNLVYETEALGGQAIWDGRDFSGRRVATGVYLVFATNTRNLDATEAIVAKILFIH